LEWHNRRVQELPTEEDDFGWSGLDGQTLDAKSCILFIEYDKGEKDYGEECFLLEPKGEGSFLVE
jgi:hypothetical protein